MQRLILKPRNLGYTNLLGIMHRAMFMSNSAKLEAGLFAFKAQYGLVKLPWWLLPDGVPITDPRRLLAAGNEPSYYMGIDIGYSRDVPVVEIFERPSPEYPDGSYRREVAGKVIEASGRFANGERSIYWHGSTPFAMVNWWRDLWVKGETEK